MGYCWDGSVPVLGINPRGGETRRAVLTREHLTGGTLVPPSCPPNSLSSESRSNSSPQFIAPAPSALQTMIPMEILVGRVPMDERRGLKYLDHLSLNRYYECQPSKSPLVNEGDNGGNQRCTPMTFQTPDHPIVALVSFHGSGNTWVRYLLEQATGIYSGAVYCDQSLKNTFPGEAIVSGNVIAVKTHQSDSIKLPVAVQAATGKETYDKAIVLVRDPYDALVSEANRRWNERGSVNRHTGLASESAFLSKSIHSLLASSSVIVSYRLMGY